MVRRGSSVRVRYWALHPCRAPSEKVLDVRRRRAHNRPTRALRASGRVVGVAAVLVFGAVLAPVAGGVTTTDHIVAGGKLVASDGAADDDLGTTVAASADGTTIVSGAPYASGAAPGDGR